MKLAKCAGLLVVGVAVTGMFTSSAKADGFGFGYWARGYYPIVDWSSAYRADRIPIPPYFALHPPVYYGTRVHRPYGYSPYTNYPPYQPTRQVVFEQAWESSLPVTVENPHVRRKKKALSQAAAVEPKWVHNPFVFSDDLQAKVAHVPD